MKRSHKFANIVFGSGIAFCLAILIYATVLSPSSSHLLQKYPLASLVGVVLFGFALMLREQTKVNLALATISIGVAVYLVEIFLFFSLSIWNPIQQGISLAAQNGLSYDTRTKYQVVVALREQGIDAYPTMHPASLVGSNGLPVGEENIYPFGGVSEKHTIHCNESGEWVIFDSDAHGFNNPPSEASLWEKNNGQLEVDIVLVGDSFTHGYCVKPGEEIAGQLRKDDRKVLNLGYSSNGPLIELATLKEYGEPFKPRIVLWVYFERNDLEDLLNEKNSSLLLNYLDKGFSQGLLKRQTEIDRLLMMHSKAHEERTKAKEESLGSDWASLVRLYNVRTFLDYYIDDTRDKSPALPLFREILAEAKDRTDSWGGKLYFVYLPVWDRYDGNLDQDNLYNRQDVLSLVEELSIPIIDFHEVMSIHPDPLSIFPFRIRGHYTAEGYRLLAEQIDTYLESDSGE